MGVFEEQVGMNYDEVALQHFFENTKRVGVMLCYSLI